MIGIDNHSGFPAEMLSLPDSDGQEIPLLLVSSTWLHSALGEWQHAPEQAPICFADEYYGDPPAYSSLTNEAQTATEKPLIDVLVNGSAYAPGGKPASSLLVELYAGTIAKQIRVVGDRHDTLVGPSWPEVFISMPIVYERAYGGANITNEDPRRHSFWRQNPAGVSYRQARSQSPAITTAYPNLEPVRGSLDGPPAGFGIISRGWSPRLEFAGTYDAKWQEEQWPLLPKDFDIRHYQAAPPDQQVVSLKTGDPVRLVNLTPDGLWQFSMPQTTLEAWLILGNGKQEICPRMDTVLIEPDHRRVTMVFRLNLASYMQRERIHEVVIGPVTKGYLRAKERRKAYLDFKLSKDGAGDENQ
jgi:hypothetical protein